MGAITNVCIFIQSKYVASCNTALSASWWNVTCSHVPSNHGCGVCSVHTLILFSPVKDTVSTHCKYNVNMSKNHVNN